jgi:dienelactone hydrolase
VQKSNFSGAPAQAGRYQGLGPYGTYDMIGNAREWVINSEGENRFILGGAWNSATYLSYDPEALPALDRSATNGFRCVRNISPAPAEITAPIKTLARDFSAKPVPDDVYRAYLELYRYVKTPLHAKDEGVVQDTADWRMERITFDTDYDRTRMAGYLFLPKNVKPPYQTVIFSPSARVSFLHDSRHLGDLPFFDYIVQSGRAVFYPIIQGTYERQDHMVLPGMSGEVDQIAMRFKDFARSLDYLNSRSDIDKSKMAYVGVSMGAAQGVIYMAQLQDHFKTAIFLDGGYFLNKVPPEIDQANFAPRLKLPVLMVNGRYDFTFSLDRSQDPLFRTLGTPEADKEHVVLETPHDVSQRHDELSHAVLGWLDKYLGRVE